MTENLALKAASLYAKGSTHRDIGKDLDVSKSSVGKLIREGYSILLNRSENSDENPGNEIKGELGDNPGGEVLEILGSDVKQDYDYDGILEKSFLVKATPILRKVALNPRIFFYFEYAKKKFDWKGDIGDFLVECVEDFWKNKGYSIRIVYDEELTI